MEWRSGVAERSGCGWPVVVWRVWLVAMPSKLYTMDAYELLGLARGQEYGHRDVTKAYRRLSRKLALACVLHSCVFGFKSTSHGILVRVWENAFTHTGLHTVQTSYGYCMGKCIYPYMITYCSTAQCSLTCKCTVHPWVAVKCMRTGRYQNSTHVLIDGGCQVRYRPSSD